MDNSLKTGFMAVFAVSGSVVFLAMHAHDRLLSNFMKKMEFEINNFTGSVKDEPIKKKVRFADDVVESTAEIAYGKKDPSRRAGAPPLAGKMVKIWRLCPKIGKLCTKGFYNTGTLGVITKFCGHIYVFFFFLRRRYWWMVGLAGGG
ncbi:hypothetical protein DH2020_018284 [Rehmannia glutinosa]|uniref:Transmembrane protein n=1 Tax=Rehmannia glutinosa TaxID=99300 RepID=A0ABR0WM16_REHGL